MLPLRLLYLSTTNPPKPSLKKRTLFPYLPASKRPYIEVTKSRDPILAYNHQRADLIILYTP